jgi:hypothetical protein
MRQQDLLGDNTIFLRKRNKNMAEEWKITQVYTPSMQRRYEIVG